MTAAVTRERSRRSSSGRLENRSGTSKPISSPRAGLGNQALQRFLQGRTIQAKLAVNQPGEKYEQEADRVADQVMRMAEPLSDQAVPEERAATPHLQRVCSECEEEMQRQPLEEEEEELQRQPLEEGEEEEIVQAKESPGATPAVSGSTEQRIRGLKGGGRALPASTRAFFEPRFGRSFDQVRVHTDSTASEMAKCLGARAFTLGEDIVFRSGEFDSCTAFGQHLLADELSHVVQQGAAESIAAKADARLIQRQTLSTIPFEEGADDTCTVTLERFIELVEFEEARYPKEEQGNTRLMLTHLRKVFYGKKGWDEHLISGASSVSRPYTTSETERDRFDLPFPWAFDVTVTARDYEVTDPETDETPEIARSQEVRLPDGTCIDLGHVFAGLDAINYPQMVDGPGTVNITSNLDAVTWVGDLASVQAELIFKFLRGGSKDLTSSDWQTIINEYAPARDMLGNIDAYVVGGAYDVTAQLGGKRVSEILREYYLGARGTTGGDARAHRYSTFAAAIGLTGWDKASFSNEISWLNDYADEVNDAAALYIGANTRGWWNLTRYGFILGAAQNNTAKPILEKFLTELKSRIAAEPQ